MGNGSGTRSLSTIRIIPSKAPGAFLAGEPDYAVLGSEGTFSWGGYFNTQNFADPVEQTIGILMKQTQGPVNDDTGWRFQLLVNQAIDD